MLSPTLLKLLRVYWKEAHPKDWLFPGDRPEQPITACAVQTACRQALEQSGPGKAISEGLAEPGGICISGRAAPGVSRATR